MCSSFGTPAPLRGSSCRLVRFCWQAFRAWFIPSSPYWSSMMNRVALFAFAGFLLACPQQTDTRPDPVCGDGKAEAWESCDDGNDIATDECTNECKPARCGDGIVREGIEECDDGNTIKTDTCLNDCRNSYCGDGYIHEGVEDCDDRNERATDDCNACSFAACGDGAIQAGEECDDGNEISTDACLSDCTEANCGDGVVQEGEEACDDGNDVDTDDCLSNCIEARCGDGIIQGGVEDCDDANEIDTDACRNTCVAAVCGDGVLQEGVEGCDDGNLDTGDGCASDCRVESCGDGVVQEGEECDDGNEIDTDACTVLCADAVCGDGIVQEVVEACDDGNEVDTDACLNTCEVASCGDGVTQEGVEDCDDANDEDGDECSNACQSPACGDGIVQAGEACDDGNDQTMDACSGCQIVSGGLQFSELVVTPTDAEYVEIHNPSDQDVDLAGLYIADYPSYWSHAYDGGSEPARSDFFARFPEGATIAPRGFVVVSIQSASDYQEAYGQLPDYDLDSEDALAPSLIGEIGSSATLTNGDEMVILFSIDENGVVTDLDYLLWGNRDDALTKGGQAVGDHVYAAETPAGEQAYIGSPRIGQSAHRCDPLEGDQAAEGGNGADGADETSENLGDTWSFSDAPSPRAAPAPATCLPEEG
ncbi:MAG: hypothetical protein CMH58_00765 [Myxococcales bacterium]|nr:hypothetical protein [Myxococcales bacterium]